MRTIGLEQCLAFINCEIKPHPAKPRAQSSSRQWRAVTISRQAGAGGHAFGERLAELLRERMPGSGRPWTLFDKNLVERVLEDHHLPKSLERFMPEDKVSEMSDTIDELFGLHPPSWTLVRQTAETILRLVELGNVIILGRAANLVTSSLDSVFHVRLVGSKEKRSERIQRFRGLKAREALAQVRREDRGRERYVKKHFESDVADPLSYHLVINTDWLEPDEAAEWVAHLLTEVPAGVTKPEAI